MVQRALYHVHRLPYDLFRFPVSPDRMPPAPQARHTKGLDDEDQEEAAETFLDLGMVNHAELVAYSALERDELPARACELLAIVYTVKGDREAARPLLGLLGKSIVHREWAERYTDWLNGESDEELAGRIREIRSNMVGIDAPEDGPMLVSLRMDGWNWELAYRKLLSVNPQNRMAFEYLISHYLLTNRPDQVVRNLSRLGEFGYSELPTVFQEAVLMDYGRTGEFPDGVAVEDLDPALRHAYEEMMSAYRDHDGDPAATLDAILGRHGDTYFAYYMWSLRNANP
jgi:hypothetical protein